MKHRPKTTIILISLFIIAQFFGIITFSLNTQPKQITRTIINQTTHKNQTINITQFNNAETVLGQRPEMNAYLAILYILIGILFSTILLLIIIKIKIKKVWSGWFFLAVWLSITITLGVWFNYFIRNYYISAVLSIITAFILTYYKIKTKNSLLHNITEIMVYTGITLLFAPILNITSAIILLLIISGYDMLSVWKTKHMVTMAKFLTSSREFSGFMIKENTKEDQYKKADNTNKSNIRKELNEENIKNIKPKTTNAHSKDNPDNNYINTKNNKKNKYHDDTGMAILGGGDVSFPMWFSSVYFLAMLNRYHTYLIPFALSSIIIASATASLILLFIYSKKGRYYPAMPFLTAGLLVGYLIVSLL